MFATLESEDDFHNEIRKNVFKSKIQSFYPTKTQFSKCSIRTNIMWFPKYRITRMIELICIQDEFHCFEFSITIKTSWYTHYAIDAACSCQNPTIQQQWNEKKEKLVLGDKNWFSWTNYLSSINAPPHVTLLKSNDCKCT